MPGKNEQQFREWIEGVRKKACHVEDDLLGYFEPIIRGFIARKISDSRFDDRNDLLQDVLIAVLHALRTGKINPENAGALPTYIYRIARNKINDYLRQEIRQRERRIDLNIDDFSSSQSPDIIFDEKETRNNLLKAIEKLPKKYRLPIIDRYIYRKKRSEIRNALGLKSDQEVSDLISYGFELLRKFVGRKEFSNLLLFLKIFPVSLF